MFERRLFFHVDWLLLGAILLLAGIGVAMIYSTTYVTCPTAAAPGPAVLDAALRARPRLIALLVCLTIDYRKLAENSLVLYGGLLALLVFVLFRDRRRRRAALDRARPVQPAALGVRAHDARADARDVLRREPPRRAQYGDLVIGGIFVLAVPADRQAAGPRHRGDADSGLFFGVAYLAGLRLRLLGDRWRDRRPAGADRLELRAQGLPENAHRDLHRSGAGSAGRRLPAASGADHGRIRRPDRQGVHEGHAGAVQVPAGRAQRFHLLGARRGERVPRRARRAGVVSVRDSEIRSRRPGWPRTASARIWWEGSFRDLRSR